MSGLPLLLPACSSHQPVSYSASAISICRANPPITYTAWVD